MYQSTSDANILINDKLGNCIYALFAAYGKYPQMRICPNVTFRDFTHFLTFMPIVEKSDRLGK